MSQNGLDSTANISVCVQTINVTGLVSVSVVLSARLVILVQHASMVCHLYCDAELEDIRSEFIEHSLSHDVN